MKKKGLALAGLLILLGIGMTLNAETAQNTEPPRERLRNALHVRHAMREIERKAIEGDTELQGIVQNIKTLHQQMRERLESKLANDAEYQNLKKQMEEMRKEWKEKGGYKGPAGEQGAFQPPLQERPRKYGR